MTSRQDSLLAALQRKTSPPPVPSAAPPPLVAPSLAKPARRIGKPVQFWLHDEDRKIVRELSAWLAGQGIRPTDSMVVRAALRMAKPGGPFLDAYRQSALLDGRLRASRPVSDKTR
jgi:hypothetical protein